MLVTKFTEDGSYESGEEVGWPCSCSFPGEQYQDNLRPLQIQKCHTSQWLLLMMLVRDYRRQNAFDTKPSDPQTRDSHRRP